jgi:uncharacterized phiE125 gp8 family phage protein
VNQYVRVAVEPTIEPVSLTEAKTWCRIDSDITDQDAIITLLIKAARERAEDITGRAFIPRTLTLILDAFPDSDQVIRLPNPPIIDVESITYIDGDGAEQVMSGSPTQWHLDTETARLSPLYGQYWPTAREQAGAVRIRYTCGYQVLGSPNGDTEQRAAIPAVVRLWMQARLSTLYENRENVVVGTIFSDMPRDFVDGLLDQLRVGEAFA